MDVLRPPLFRVENRIYRLNLVDGEESNTIDNESMAPYIEEDLYQENEKKCDIELEDMEHLEGCRVEKKEDRLCLTLTVPSSLHRFLIGRQGETRQRLEAETGCRLIVPPKNSPSDSVFVEARDWNTLSSVKTRLDMLLNNARQRIPFTHFLSVSCVSVETCASFERFCSKVLAECSNDRGVNASLFQRPARLHLTLDTLTLLSESEVRRADQVLQDCADLVSSVTRFGAGLQFHLSGIEYMNDSPTEVDVLYARVSLDSDGERLQLLADSLVDRFVQAGLIRRSYASVKLHVTLMNSKFRQSSTREQASFDRAPTRSKRENFDARGILQRFKDFDFGVVKPTSVQLSARHTSDAHGYYKAAASILLN